MSIETVEITSPGSFSVVEIRQGPAGTGGGGSNSITSATTSDGTADLDLLNVTTATAEVTGTLTANHIHGNLAGNVYAHVRAGEALTKGDPVYVSGSHGSGSTLIAIVSKADASNAAKMPAVGIMDAAVANNANGHMVITGTITEFATNAYSINAELYVAAGGGMTATPPTERAQPVARVERSNLNNGAILVKVNGLSASDATASTLVRRDASGGANFAGTVNLAIGVVSDLRFEDYQAAVGATFTYGAGSDAAHRTALGATATGVSLFTAATPAAARETLMGEVLKYAASAGTTRTNPTAYVDDDVLFGTSLTAGMWEIDFYFSFDTGTCGVATNLVFGTPGNVGLSTDSRVLGSYFRGGNVAAGLGYRTGTGQVPLISSPSAAQTDFQYVGSFMIPITGANTLKMQFSVSANVPGQTITRRAGAFLRARKING